MSGIRSKKHKIVTYTSNKKSVSCFDNKHYILSDGNYHMDIKIYQKMNKYIYFFNI